MSVPVTEDTPPDMLAGGMDLSVLLPDGRAGKLTVQRATPMMDLLVQLCTSYRLAPGSHVLQPLGENGPLPYKPSTPIGLLDAWSVRLLPRQRSAGSLQPQNALPFQHTFRLQIHLPRNQLLVQRVSPQTVLSSVLKLACDEKNLDGNKYELRHPGNLEERLQLDLTLADYGLSEVAVVSKIDGGADILALQREQDRRRRRVKAGHLPPTQPGCIKKKSSGFDGSVSSGRSSSPDSSGVTPPQGTINVAPKVIPANADITIANQPMAPPKAPFRKRRPAPPPPQAKSESARQDETPAVTHSRTSSDSSGYHEASVLSDGPENNQVPLGSTEVHTNSTIPRRSKLPSSASTGMNLRPQEKVNSTSLSRSMSNLTENGLNSNRVNGELSASTSSLSSGHGYRKKKAAPPPPPVVSKTSSLERKVNGSEISNHLAKNRTLPRAMSTSSISSRNSQRAPSIEEEESSQPTIQHELVKTKVAVHNQDLVTPTMRANLVAELNNRFPNLRNDSVSSDGSNTGSSISSVVEEPVKSKPEPIYAKVVRPSRQKNGAEIEKVVSSDHVVNHTSNTKTQEPEMKTEIVKPPIPGEVASQPLIKIESYKSVNIITNSPYLVKKDETTVDYMVHNGILPDFPTSSPSDNQLQATLHLTDSPRSSSSLSLDNLPDLGLSSFQLQIQQRAPTPYHPLGLQASSSPSPTSSLDSQPNSLKPPVHNHENSDTKSDNILVPLESSNTNINIPTMSTNLMTKEASETIDLVASCTASASLNTLKITSDNEYNCNNTFTGNEQGIFIPEQQSESAVDLSVPPPLPKTPPPDITMLSKKSNTTSLTRKVSIFVPPPPEVRLNRGESAESWNKFLAQLDEILERHAEFV